MKHFLNLLPHSPELLRKLIADAIRIKTGFLRGEEYQPLKNKIIGLVFEKPSLRTRVSFESGIVHLGGHSLFQAGNEVGLGTRETEADFARTMSQFVNGIVLRVFRHQTVEAVAKHATVPVINGLSDISHPCQALSDILTIQERLGSFDGKTVAFVGDGNNVARSLAVACGKLGMKFILARPEGYGFPADFNAKYQQFVSKQLPTEMSDPLAAVRNADVIYTDVWTSMGQEAEQQERLKKFAPYQVNEALLAKAPKHAIVLHCLPAHRGEEVSEGIFEAHAEAIFQQAGNRLHGQKSILVWLLGE